MASGRLADYLGTGAIASRPATPSLYSATLGLWYATDTGALSAWDGSAWVDVATFASPVGLPSYTVATLPAATPAGRMIYVSDESGGAIPAFSDATNWRRVSDRAIVS